MSEESEQGTANSERLNQIFDTSSEKNRNALLSFLAVQLYLFATIGSTTDLQLLLSNTAFNLPLVNIGIPIVGFYIFAPVLFLILHFNLLLNLSEHVDILHDWQGEQSSKLPSKHRFPYLINIIAYYQAHAGHDGKGLRGGGFKLFITKGVAILAIGGFPVALLLFFQYRFSDYQSVWITGLHTLIVLTDLLVLYLYARNFKLPVLTALNQWAYRGFMTVVVGFSGVMLLVVILVVHSPWLFVDEEKAGRELPNPWYMPYIEVSEEQVSPIKDELKNTYSLEVRNQTPKFWNLYKRIKFENRNFNFANFDRAVMYNVDFRHVNMYGITGESVSFQGANFSKVNITKALLQYADFTYSSMNEITFKNTALSNARFTRASIDNLTIDFAYLDRVQFMGANLKGVKASKAYLKESKFNGAYLFDFDLSTSNLFDADFIGVRLFNSEWLNSNIDRANFKGAYFNNIELDFDMLTQMVIEDCVINDLTLTEIENIASIVSDLNTSLVSCISIFKPTLALKFGLKHEAIDKLNKAFIYKTEQSREKNAGSTPEDSRLNLFLHKRQNLICQNRWSAFGIVKQNQNAKDSAKWMYDGALISYIENDDVCKHNKVKEFLLEHYDRADELF